MGYHQCCLVILIAQHPILFATLFALQLVHFGGVCNMHLFSFSRTDLIPSPFKTNYQTCSERVCPTCIYFPLLMKQQPQIKSGTKHFICTSFATHNARCFNLRILFLFLVFHVVTCPTIVYNNVSNLYTPS